MNPFNAPKICLFTGLEERCQHAECLYGKSVAQTQKAKATSAGMLANFQDREERSRFREQMHHNSWLNGRGGAR